MKINFTETNLARLKELANKMLFTEGAVISYGMGQIYNIVELIHTVSIGTLNNIRLALSKKIEQQESRDEWIDPDNSKLEQLREQKELVNLIIGYKRKELEKKENEQKRAALLEKINNLEESQKTPEDKIKEAKAELAALEEF